MIERRHIDQKASGKRDVAGDARALFAERLLGDLDDDFLALLQHVRDELRTARLRDVMTMAVTTAATMLRTASTVVATSTIASTAAAGFCMRERKSSRTWAFHGCCSCGG